MRSAKLSDVKDRLSEYVALVRKGETVRIFVRGEAAADLVPIEAPVREEERLEEHLRRLEKAGTIRRGTGRPVSWLFQPAGSSRGEPLSAIVRREREEGW